MMKVIFITTRTCFVFGAAVLLFASIARSGDSSNRRAADDLLRMTPADAAIVATIENLRDRAPIVTESPVFKRLCELPAVRTWWESEGSAKILSARDHIEKSLGYPWPILRDEILGDAVVAAFAFDPGAPNDAPRGLILLRAREPKILETALKNANEARRRDKSLESIDVRRAGSVEYSHRSFIKGKRPDDYLAILPGGTLVWSNNEAWLKRAIDRGRGDESKGMRDNPLFESVRGDLPGDSLIQIFIEPRFLEKLLKARKQIDRDGEKGIRFLLALLEPIRYAAAAIAWREGPVIDAREILEPGGGSKVVEPAKKAEFNLDDLTKRIPGEPILIAGGRLDRLATGSAVLNLLDDDEREAIDLAHAFIKGMLLGNDLKTAILPAIRTGIFVVSDDNRESPRRAGDRAPIRSREVTDKRSRESSKNLDRDTNDNRTPSRSAIPVQLLGIIRTSGDEAPRGPVAAIENLLESTLAFLALTTAPASKLAERSIGSAKVHRIEGAEGDASPAFARDRSVFVVGSTAEIVERACALVNNKTNTSRIHQFLRSRPKSIEEFVYIDMRSLRNWIERRAQANELADQGGDAIDQDIQKPRETRPGESVLKSREAERGEAIRNNEAAGNQTGKGGGDAPKSIARNDLDQAGRLFGLFDHAFITNETSPDRSIARQTAGIVANSPKQAP
jgi:hypothetical protein